MRAFAAALASATHTRRIAVAAGLGASGFVASYVATTGGQADARATPVASAGAAPSIREHRTGLPFLLARGGTDAITGAADDMLLLGANTRCVARRCALSLCPHLVSHMTPDAPVARCMLGWCRLAIARAYAFGLYADAEALDVMAGGAGGAATGGAGGHGADRIRALLDRKASGAPGGELALVLVMARDIPGEHLAHGFRNSIAARVLGGSAVPGGRALETGRAAAAGGTAGPPPAASAPAAAGAAAVAVVPGAASAPLAAFAAAFHGRAFQVGDEIALVWRRDGVLVASVCGEPLRGAELADPALARALFDVYVGAHPVSQRAKATFERNVEAAAAAGVVAAARGASGGAAAKGEASAAPPPLAAAAARARDALVRALPPSIAALLPPAAPVGGALAALPRGAAAPRATVDADRLTAIVAAEHASRTK